jgi:hypothetical protein
MDFYLHNSWDIDYMVELANYGPWTRKFRFVFRMTPNWTGVLVKASKLLKNTPIL